MHTQHHHNTNSTNFTLYNKPLENNYIVQTITNQQQNLSTNLEFFLNLLHEHNNDFLNNPTHNKTNSNHISMHIKIREPTSLNN